MAPEELNYFDTASNGQLVTPSNGVNTNYTIGGIEYANTTNTEGGVSLAHLQAVRDTLVTPERAQQRAIRSVEQQLQGWNIDPIPTPKKSPNKAPSLHTSRNFREFLTKKGII